MADRERRDELRQHYLEVRKTLLAAIDGLSDEQMLDASIDRWSPKDHLAHLTVWDEIRAQEIERISSGGASAWPMMTDDEVEQLNGLTAKLRHGLSVDQVLRELDVARERVLEAIANASEQGLDGSLYGEAGLRSTHDLAHADAIRRWRDSKGF